MAKREHEFRDPVHGFIRLSADERKLIDSVPFQRLRHIHQLAMSYMVYPGATHRRFEHSLGCMELATRIFDTITNPENLRALPQELQDRLMDTAESGKKQYRRRVLRLAALCHDLGHLPFSHAAEELLPEGMNHEVMTKRLIMETNLLEKQEKPCPSPADVAKIAVGKKHAAELGEFDEWDDILCEIITGDVFGADRMDYLLRDSYHAGVTYGHFDLLRLIDTLRLLPGVPEDSTEEYSQHPTLGIERGGLQVAESLLVARYLMFTQVYLHHVRRIYDIHLKAFLQQRLPEGRYPTDPDAFLGITDNEVLTWIREAARENSTAGHDHARILHTRKHFKMIFHPAQRDCKLRMDIAQTLHEQLKKKFGQDTIIFDEMDPKETKLKKDFPIVDDKGNIFSAMGESKILVNLPPATTNYIYAHPETYQSACDSVKILVDKLMQEGRSKPCTLM